MMIVINENNFFPNRSLDASATSFEYYEEPVKSIVSKFSLDFNGFESKDLDGLCFKVLFSEVEIGEPNFMPAVEYSLVEHLSDGSINISIPTDVGVTNLFVYLKVYNKESALFSNFTKVFASRIIENGNVVSTNFVDLRLESANSVTVIVQDQKQILNDLFVKNQDDLTDQGYISNLFFSVKEQKSVNMFLGLDQEKYFKDKNYIPFLQKDEEFQDYLKNNSFIIQQNGTIYNSVDRTALQPQVFVESGLEEVFGTLYQVDFTISGDKYRKENYGYEVEFVLEDAISKYAVDVLLPALDEESVFLDTLKIEEGEFVRISNTSVINTIKSLRGSLLINADDLGDTLITFDNSSTGIVLNNLLRKFLLNTNRLIKELILSATNFARLSSSPTSTLSRDYGEIVDVKDIDTAAKVIEFTSDQGALVRISLTDFVERANQESKKYFNEQTEASVATKSGEQLASPQSLSLSYLTAESYRVQEQEVLKNDKSIDYDFSYDDFLQYVKAIDLIIANKINYDVKISTTNGLDKVTASEFTTEQQSEQITSILNSMTITEVPFLKTEKDRESLLTELSNVIKTFEIPSTLRTDLCVSNVDDNDPRNKSTNKVDVSPSNFIGNNLLAFTIFNRLESFYKKKFYDFYDVYENVELDLESLPVQALFLYKYYRENLDVADFLKKENLYSSFVVYGIIFFMFKSLFRVNILLPEKNEFVLLTQDVVNNLETNQNYLCQLDQYSNKRLGITTPDLLLTSIYNRYFILEA